MKSITYIKRKKNHVMKEISPILKVEKTVLEFCTVCTTKPLILSNYSLEKP